MYFFSTNALLYALVRTALISSIALTDVEAAKCGDFFYNECSKTDSDVRYDPDASIALKDQDPIWSKMEGFWIGNYTFFDGEGIPQASSTYDEDYGYGWPYGYADYRGAINITIIGSRYYQHNYFFYPPASSEFCNENSDPPPGKLNAYGSGACGVNGGFKSFDAFGTSSHEKDGTMHSLPGAGTYADFVNIAYPVDGNTLLYTSTDDSSQFHSQINVFYPDDKTRTRTAYGFDYKSSGRSNPLFYSSLYREQKVTEEEFLKKLEEFSTMYNIPTEDVAPYPMKTTCLKGDWAGGVGAVCPTEDSFCDVDPACSQTPYSGAGPTVNAVKVGGFIALAFIILIVIGALLAWKAVRNVRVAARKKFQNAIGGSMVEWSSLNKSPKELLKIFESIDTDGSGLITKGELDHYTKEEGGLKDKELRILFDDLDIDGSGGVDFAEFCAFTAMTDRARGNEAFEEDEA